MRRMYSQNELEKLVKDVFLADIESGEIDFVSIIEDALPVADLSNLDLSVKSITSNPNWELNLTEIPITISSDFTAEFKYGKLEIINGILYIVAVIKVTNTTSA